MAYDEDLANRIRDAEDLRTKRQLAAWVARGTGCARSLPTKSTHS
jgi:hypothetical protein